jgi:hypothetical protein
MLTWRAPQGADEARRAAAFEARRAESKARAAALTEQLDLKVSVRTPRAQRRTSAVAAAAAVGR